MVHPVFIQAFSYGFVLFLSLFAVSMILKGFFINYMIVRLSFGKFILVKVRSTLRDYFSYGVEDDGFLLYKKNKKTKRIALDGTKSDGTKLDGRNAIYRCLGVNWIDVNESKNAICFTDYSTVSGFDSVKYSDLYTRALMMPQISSSQDKLILTLLVGLCAGVIVAIYLGYMNTENVRVLIETVKGIKPIIANAGGI